MESRRHLWIDKFDFSETIVSQSSDDIRWIKVMETTIWDLWLLTDKYFKLNKVNYSLNSFIFESCEIYIHGHEISSDNFGLNQRMSGRAGRVYRMILLGINDLICNDHIVHYWQFMWSAFISVHYDRQHGSINQGFDSRSLKQFVVWESIYGMISSLWMTRRNDCANNWSIDLRLERHKRQTDRL
jgi:hypothetical protein